MLLPARGADYCKSVVLNLPGGAESQWIITETPETLVHLHHGSSTGTISTFWGAIVTIFEIVGRF